MSLGNSQPKDSGLIVIDGISYIPSSALLTGISKVSFKDNRAFAVMDPLGESPRLYRPESELGLYFNDTRYLGVWELSINDTSPVSLANELRFGGSTAVFSMTNRDLVEGGGRIRRDTFLIRRVMTLYRDTLFESIEIKNFDSSAHSLKLEYWAGSMFEDLFEVRGYTRAERGHMLAPEEVAAFPCEEIGTKKGGKIFILKYEGLDHQIRKVLIQPLFETEKTRVSPCLIGYRHFVRILPKGSALFKTVISFDEPSSCHFFGRSYGEISLAEKLHLSGDAAKTESPFQDLHFESDNAIVNRSILHAITDISVLLTQESSSILYPYAGIPWFSAPFGRDGIITAYQLLPWFPLIARGVLDYVFQNLGTRTDPFTDEEPGKVFHELRRGEMARTREVPFIPYYGSVDSTPLALILLHEYIRWTLDRKKLEEWWPLALKALHWINRWGDSDGDGLLEYSKQSPSGLVNQGWKDSHDSIMHSDGRLAQAPIRLCEVQGYAFRAKLGMSALARFLGHENLAHRLRKEALELKSLFWERFWDSEGRYFYLALDGDAAPCSVRASNMGHCLWSQICSPEQAVGVAKNLMSDAMFSGHGIRTLASSEVAYNPLSYHNGSVWPHDNSFIMEGFRQYGFVRELDSLTRAFLGVLEASDDFRLPELYCGFRKRGTEPPIPYQVACKPQAWAAGSIFLMLKSMLGLSLDLDQSFLVFNSPLLTSMMSYLQVKNLKARDFGIDFVIRRTAHGATTVEVIRKEGSVRVLTVR